MGDGTNRRARHDCLEAVAVDVVADELLHLLLYVSNISGTLYGTVRWKGRQEADESGRLLSGSLPARLSGGF